MRIHRLRITAFGPFAGTVEVDLDALAANGLFLLHGPTGAGKTSVLDAVCFALYGTVPGSRHGARLRSDHAAEGLAPEVVCEFSAGGRRLEVTRSPAWERPKRRGAGTTTEQARVLLQELGDEGWQPLTNRVDEAALALDDVLGLGLEQFTKLVLLPQGEFAAFLRADAETRRALLERLFGTDRFGAVQQWLRESQAGLRALVEAADVATGQLCARAEQAALPAGVHLSEGDGDGAGPTGGQSEGDGDGDRDAGPDGVSAREPAAVVARLRAAVAAALEEARARRVAAQERARHAAAEHEAARRTAELQGRHRELTAAAGRLRSCEPEQERRRKRLSAARRAGGLSRWLAPLDAARVRSQAALEGVDAALVEFVECGPLRAAPPGPEAGDVQLWLVELDDVAADDRPARRRTPRRRTARGRGAFGPAARG